MVNVTRLHNAAAAASYMRRITALAQVPPALHNTCKAPISSNAHTSCLHSNLQAPALQLLGGTLCS